MEPSLTVVQEVAFLVFWFLTVNKDPANKTAAVVRPTLTMRLLSSIEYGTKQLAPTHMTAILLRLLRILLLLGSVLTTVAQTDTSLPPLSDSYHLDELVWRRGTPGTWELPPYRYPKQGDDVSYTVHLQPLDPAPRGCRRRGAVAYELNLSIANHFYTTLCLLPRQTKRDVFDQDNNSNVTNFRVRMLRRMVSTQLYPLDAGVRHLETFWGRSLPRVTRATLDDQGNLHLRAAQGKVKMVWTVVVDDEQEQEEDIPG